MSQTPAGALLVAHIAANGTTTLKSGPGYLHCVTINTKGVGNTLTVYDSLSGSGTVLTVIDTTFNAVSLFYDVQCLVGLTLVVAGGTAPDLTVSYA